MIDVWIDAFIPEGTLSLDGGLVSGYIGFYGDARGFEKGGGARLAQWLVLQIHPNGTFKILANRKSVGTTVGIRKDMSTVTAKESASGLEATVRQSGTKIAIEIRGTGTMPLLTRSPAIEYQYVLELQAVRNGIACSRKGRHDGFPNYSVWLGNRRIYGHEHPDAGLAVPADGVRGRAEGEALRDGAGDPNRA